MGELADLLELIQGAARSFASVRGVARSWEHRDRQERLRRRFVETRGGAARQVMVARGVPRRLPAVTETATRFWLQRPDRLREQTDDAETGHLLVQVGTTWWSYTHHGGALTNEGSPDHLHGLSLPPSVLDPTLLVGGFDLAVGPTVERHGRTGIAVSARARPREHWMPERSPPFDLDGDHDLVVDLERGVLLEDVALLDGEPASRLELTELAFDEPFADETFVFRAPDDEPARPVRDAYGRRETLPLHELARRAPFGVFAFANLAEGWFLHASLHTPAGRPPTANLLYTRRESPALLIVAQQAADPGETLPPRTPDGAAWDTLTVAGRPAYLWSQDATAEYTQRGLVTLRDDTRIQVQSGELTADELVEVAARLRPAPIDAPPLPG